GGAVHRTLDPADNPTLVIGDEKSVQPAKVSSGDGHPEPTYRRPLKGNCDTCNCFVNSGVRCTSRREPLHTTDRLVSACAEDGRGAAGGARRRSDARRDGDDSAQSAVAGGLELRGSPGLGSRLLLSA